MAPSGGPSTSAAARSQALSRSRARTCGRTAAGYGESMAFPVMLGVRGFVFGVIIGRWWASLGAVAVGIWAAVTHADTKFRRGDGGIFGGATAIGIVGGVAVRRFAFREPDEVT